MKDSELRGRVLSFLYRHRRAPFVEFPTTAIPDGVDQHDWLRACEQLIEHGLITEVDETLRLPDGRIMEIRVRINAFGTNVIEGESTSPISIAIDQSQEIHVSGSQNVQIARDNANQQQTIVLAFENIASAIETAPVSQEEKNDAKSLLQKVIESKAVSSIVGAASEGIVKGLTPR